MKKNKTSEDKEDSKIGPMPQEIKDFFQPIFGIIAMCLVFGFAYYILEFFGFIFSWDAIPGDKPSSDMSFFDWIMILLSVTISGILLSWLYGKLFNK